MNVAHITSVHKRYDSRIFLKQCISLAENNHKVSLIVADGNGNETKNGVNFVDVGNSKNRLYRMLITTVKIYFAALRTKAKVIHFHDPELLFVGLFMKIFHRKYVIYDIHENYRKTIQNRTWLANKFISKTIAFIFGKLEYFVSSFFSFNIVVLDVWKKNYKNSIVVKNYPKAVKKIVPVNQKKNELIYVGSLSPNRGIVEMLKIFSEIRKKADFKLHIIGVFFDKEIETKFYSLLNEDVVFHGYKPITEIQEMLAYSKFGFCLYTDSKFEENIPVKMYEYLSFNTPVICTNFKSWTEQIEREKWGVLVNPFDYKTAAETIWEAFDNQKYQKLYENCEEIKPLYTWENEEKKLLELYNKLK